MFHLGQTVWFFYVWSTGLAVRIQALNILIWIDASNASTALVNGKKGQNKEVHNKVCAG